MFSIPEMSNLLIGNFDILIGFISEMDICYHFKGFATYLRTTSNEKVDIVTIRDSVFITFILFREYITMKAIGSLFSEVLKNWGSCEKIIAV